MPLLASNFDGLLPFIAGIPLAIAALGLLSFWPALRGHWSAPILATPCLLIGGLLTASVIGGGKDLIPALWVIFPAPLVVGMASFALWQSRRRRKINPDAPVK